MSSYGELDEISTIGEDLFAFEWRIPNFPSLCPAESNYYYSPHIKVCGREWYFKLRPFRSNERRNPASGWVGVTLYNPPPKTFRITVGIKGSSGVEMERGVEKEYSCCSCYDFGDFCLRSEMIEHKSRLMPEDVLTITCDVKVTGAVRAHLSTGHRSNSRPVDKCVQVSFDVSPDTEAFSSDIVSLLEEEILPDFVLKCGGRSFQVHRSVLAARSEVFRAMFTNRMQESETGSADISDLEAPVLESLLKILYSGKLGELSEATTTSLYEAADKYAVHSLRRTCSCFMISNMAEENCISYLHIAGSRADADLKAAAVSFILAHSGVFKSTAWLAFLKEHPNLASEVLQTYAVSTIQ